MTCPNYIVELKGELVEHAGSIRVNDPLRLGGSTEIELAGEYAPAYLFYARVKVYRPGTDVVLFDGVVIGASCSHEPGRVNTRIQCSDMGEVLNFRLVYGEFTGSITSVFMALLEMGEYPFGGEIDGGLIAYQVTLKLEETKLSEALDALVEQIGVESMDWNIRGSDGTVVLIDKTGSSTSTVRLPIPFCNTDGVDAWNVDWSQKKIEASMVSVYGRNGQFFDGKPFIIREIDFDIPASSQRKEFPLFEDTTEVLQVEITAAPVVASGIIAFTPGKGFVVYGNYIYVQCAYSNTIRRWHVTNHTIERFAGDRSYGIPPLSGSDLSVEPLPISTSAFPVKGSTAYMLRSTVTGKIRLELQNADSGSAWSQGFALFEIDMSDASFERILFQVQMTNTTCGGSNTATFKPINVLNPIGETSYEALDGNMTATVYFGTPPNYISLSSAKDYTALQAIDGRTDYDCGGSPYQNIWPLDYISGGNIVGPANGLWNSGSPWLDTDGLVANGTWTSFGDTISHSSVFTLEDYWSRDVGGNKYIVFSGQHTPPGYYEFDSRNEFGQFWHFRFASLLDSGLSERAGYSHFGLFGAYSIAVDGSDVYISLGEIIIKTPNLGDIDYEVNNGPFSFVEALLTGTTTLVVGKPLYEGYVDAEDPLDVRLFRAHSLQVQSGFLYWVEDGSNTCRRLDISGNTVETLFGLPNIRVSNFSGIDGTSGIGLAAGDSDDTSDRFALVPENYYFEITQGDTTPLVFNITPTAINGWTSDIEITSGSTIYWTGLTVDIGSGPVAPGTPVEITITPDGSGWQPPSYIFGAKSAPIEFTAVQSPDLLASANVQIHVGII